MPTLALLAVGMFVNGFGAFVVIGVLPAIKADLDLGPVAAGWIMTSYAIAYAVGSPLLTSLSGRFSRRHTLVGAMATIAIGLVGCALASDALSLYAARVVVALGGGVYSPAAAAAAVALMGPEKRGQALSLVFAGITAAQVIGVPAGSFLGARLGLPTLFAASAGLALVMGLALWLRVPRDLPVQPVAFRDLVATLKDARLTIAVLVTAMAMGAGWIPYTFLALVIEGRLGAGADAVALLLVAYGVGSVVGNLAGGRLADKLGSDRALLLILAAQVPFTVAVTLVDFGIVSGAILLFAWGAVGWAFTAPQQTRLVGLAPAQAPILLALNAAAIYVGAAIGSTIGGVTLAASGPALLGPVAALVIALTIGHVLLSIRMVRS